MGHRPRGGNADVKSHAGFKAKEKRYRSEASVLSPAVRGSTREQCSLRNGLWTSRESRCGRCCCHCWRCRWRLPSRF
ncbi:hypothetical protein MRX96_010606 [Rhipicephalus microplus]